jgi:hypothetical protein
VLDGRPAAEQQRAARAVRPDLLVARVVLVGDVRDVDDPLGQPGAGVVAGEGHDQRRDGDDQRERAERGSEVR